MKPIRCPKCGALENEPIEDDVAVPCLGWTGEMQHIIFYRKVTHEAYFNSEENANGETVYICSECGHKFTLKEETP